MGELGLREQLLEQFGTDDVAAIAREFDQGTRALSALTADEAGPRNLSLRARIKAAWGGMTMKIQVPR